MGGISVFIDTPSNQEPSYILGNRSGSCEGIDLVGFGAYKPGLDNSLERESL